MLAANRVDRVVAEQSINAQIREPRMALRALAGRVPRELAKHAASLLGSVPDMDKCDVLAAKLAD